MHQAMTLLNRSHASRHILGRLPALTVVIGAIVVGGAFLVRIWTPSVETSSKGAAAPQTFTVAKAPVVTPVDMVGQIEPATKTIVTAPFDGYVADRVVNLGSRVHRGDPLLTLDTSELDGRMREAESALLKAGMASDAVEKWETSPEMTRARRTLASAQATLVTLQHQCQDSKSLLDRGIISRNEYDTLKQQVESQQDQVASASQDLDSALIKGSDDNKRVAALELADAREHMEALRREANRKVVSSPVDGIVMRPPALTSEIKPLTDIVDAGTQLAKGQVLMTIAGEDRFSVEALVDEVDVNKMTVGQPIEVVSDSFKGDPIKGQVVRVSMEADQSSLSGPAKFLVTGVFSVDQERRHAVRIGMSARMTVTTYANVQALVVPQDAIALREGRSNVLKINPTSKAEELVAVELGASTPGGIEVKSGLVEGDVIVLR